MVKIEQESSDNSVCCSNDKYYPYGTSLRFEDELVDSLEVGNLVAGDRVEVRGFAFVDSTSEHTGTDGAETRTSRSVGLQLTDVKLTRITVDRVDELYGST